MNHTADITVLVVDDEHSSRELWSQIVAPIARTISASTVSEALAAMRGADILLLNWHLYGQPADTVLDRWVSEVGGPVCVLSDVETLDRLYELFSRGVYHVFREPVPINVISTVVRHYVNDVRMRRELDALAREVHSLRLWTVAFAIAAAGSIGPMVVPKLISLLTGLVL